MKIISGNGIILYLKPLVFHHYSREINPLILPLAFVSIDPEKGKNKFLAAGADFNSEICMEDGSHLIMISDSYELVFQLLKRGVFILLKRDP